MASVEITLDIFFADLTVEEAAERRSELLEFAAQFPDAISGAGQFRFHGDLCQRPADPSEECSCRPVAA